MSAEQETIIQRKIICRLVRFDSNFSNFFPYLRSYNRNSSPINSRVITKSWQVDLIGEQLGLACDGRAEGSTLDTALGSFARIIHFRISMLSTLGDLAK